MKQMSSKTQEDNSKLYIEQALFKLMQKIEFEKITVTDIVGKAGVGRATFYRHFKSKENILIYYLERKSKEFMIEQRFFPRCKEDYIKTVEKVLTMFRENKDTFLIIRKARLEYVYLDYLNKNLVILFENDYPQKHSYVPFIYAGMLFNVSMIWLGNDCRESIQELAKIIVEAIYIE